MDYLVNMTTLVPAGTADATVEDVRGREAARARELADEGHLLRLWRPPLEPGDWRTLGLFGAGDTAELEDVLASMPLRMWRNDVVTPLAPHPNDPQVTGATDATGSNRALEEFLIALTITVPAARPAQWSRRPENAKPSAPASSAGAGTS